jgi:hypoxanthine phosphoribosyltransferase
MPSTTLLKPLISTDQIQLRTKELAEEIKREFGDQQILLVAVLKGSFLFLADLIRHFGDNVMVDFVIISSYGDGTESSGNVQIRKDLDINIEGLNVLIVEDIVDTGATLSHLCELLMTRRPKSLKVVALLSKPEARRQQAPLDFVGFEIPNEFVVGYGLDYAERYRNLPYIAILSGLTP